MNFIKSPLLFSLLFFLLAPIVANAASPSLLTIYVYPPRKPLNWSSPRSLLFSFLDIGLGASLHNDNAVKFESDFREKGSISSDYRSTMGHSIAHVQCQLSSGKTYNKWTSFSGQDSREVDNKNIFDDKLGMGVMFYDYIDGHLISGAENIKRLTHYKGKLRFDPGGALTRAHPRYLALKIDNRQCDELKEMIAFFESFHFKKGTTIAQLEAKDPESVLYFTNEIDPWESYQNRKKTGRGKVGGGCAPFAVALLKSVGLYSAEFERAWSFKLPVSESLIGGIPLPKSRELRKVSLGSLVFSDLGSRWTNPGVPNRISKMYDPQKIWDFLGDSMACLSLDRAKKESCKGPAAEWTRKAGSRLQLGKRQHFRDQKMVLRHGTDGQMVSEPEPVDQAVDGLLLN